MSTDLRRIAQRAAATDAGLLATPLLAYQRRHGLSDAALAARLGVSEADLWRLCLCRRPEGADAAGWGQVVTLVECDPDALRRALEEE